MFVVVNIQVEELKKSVTFKFVPLTILEIGVGAKVTLIDTITHAYEVFRTPNIVLKYTCC
jgi:hypothetical protein